MKKKKRTNVKKRKPRSEPMIETLKRNFKRSIDRRFELEKERDIAIEKITRREKQMIQLLRQRDYWKEKYERFEHDVEAVKQPEPFRWKTADGEQLAPAQMDEQHLRNTISYLQRTLVHDFGVARFIARTEFKLVALSEMIKEASKRGFQV